MAGQLQLLFSDLARPGVDSIDVTNASLPSLIQAGYAFFIVPANTSFLDARYTEVVRSIPGESWPQRVPRNPAMAILRARDGAVEAAVSAAPARVTFREIDGQLSPECSSHEPHCWVSSLVTDVPIPSNSTAITFEAMSPWPNQTLDVQTENGEIAGSIDFPEPGKWLKVHIPLHSAQNQSVRFRLSQVHSPASRGVSADTRRIGIAIARHAVDSPR